MTSRNLLAVVIVALGVLAGCAAAAENLSPRKTISLDGVWQVGEGKMDAPPTAFGHAVPVPGLVSLATPPFVEPGPKVKDRRSQPQKDPLRDAFWYRRTFTVADPLPAVATLKIGKAMFGTRILVNGKVIGDHMPCFSPGCFDIRAALKSGENELLVRVGADRDSLPREVPDGFDFEKEHYIPGIFDSVELILSGTPNIVSVQTAPDVAAKAVRVQVVLHNAGPAATIAMRFAVCEAKSGKQVATAGAESVTVPASGDKTVDITIPIADCRLWSPEDPFLYNLTVDCPTDSFSTRFGMRELRFDPKTGHAVLNGKPYFMRGSNITLYRFFEDDACKALPWNAQWVRTLHQRIKDMHWNCLRYCIGLAPEMWYRIADEEGIMIQNEFPIWYGGKGWSVERKITSEELAREYSEWMREQWNHPCVVVWDASNETTCDETGPAVKQVRGLDISGRPWDNSYMPPGQDGDVLEEHPYHFSNPNYKLSQLATANPAPWGKKGDGHGVIINEYGWLWLNRDGTPTTLTAKLYENLLGPDSTTEQRRHLYARYTAAESEFWRSHRTAAAVVHFTTLGYSRPDGQTSDHWIDVEKLTWEGEFYKYVRDAFAPVGVMIDAWADDYLAGATQTFPVAVINDLPADWKGTVRFRLLKGDTKVQEESAEMVVAGLGRSVREFRLQLPSECGQYQVEAALMETPEGLVRSLRDFEIISQAQHRARLGLAFGKTATASSQVDANHAPGLAVDGDKATFWSSTFADPAWLAVDLGEVHKINRVKIEWERACAKEFSIQVSPDGKTWTDVYKTSDCKGGTSDIKFAPTEARHVRMNGTKRATQWGYAIYEFGVFGE